MCASWRPFCGFRGGHCRSSFWASVTVHFFSGLSLSFFGLGGQSVLRCSTDDNVDVMGFVRGLSVALLWLLGMLWFLGAATVHDMVWELN